MTESFEIRGFRVWPGDLDRPAQQALVADIRAIAAAAPFVTPVTPGGKPMSVRMTNFGALGWVTDAQQGYRYQATHPETGEAVERVICAPMIGGHAAAPAAPAAAKPAHRHGPGCGCGH